MPRDSFELKKYQDAMEVSVWDSMESGELTEDEIDNNIESDVPGLTDGEDPNDVQVCAYHL